MYRILVAVLLLIGSGPALAWDFSDDDGECSVSQSFEGPGNTLFMFWQDQDLFDDGDRVSVVLQNDNWSIEHREDLGTVRFTTESGWFENTAIGMVTENETGIVMLRVNFEYFSIAMEGYLLSLVVTRDGTTIDRLSLSGFSTYFSRFKRCRDRKVAVVRERERQERLEQTIPRDPFSDEN
jgi:hypothetical protein